ncbi:MAG TPA: cupin domain-containing protein [Clostridia bacterium]|nr:cupin domain-containing protein [Clostridia bacterium]
MIASNEKNVKAIELVNEAYKNVKGKVLVSPENGWDDYVMRLFELGKGGYSADHSHDFPHIVYVLEGEGVLHLDGKEMAIESGSFAFIPNKKRHQLVNASENGDSLRFI